jgi:toxin ParE1/3/4
LAAFRFSRLAEADLMGIGAWTLREWGAAQAIRYLDELETSCRRLADNPDSGRPCDRIRPAYAAWNTADTSCFSGAIPEAF